MPYPYIEQNPEPPEASDAKWGIIKDFISYQIADDQTATASMLYLRERGWRFDNNRFSDIWRARRDFVTDYEKITFLSDDEYISSDEMPRSRRVERGAIQVKGAFRVFDIVTGQSRTEYRTFTSSQLYSRGEYEEKLWQLFINEYVDVNTFLDGFELVGALQGA